MTTAGSREPSVTVRRRGGGAGGRIVHWHNGWFVVGEGRNGIELSVRLVAGLVAIALDDLGQRREQGETP